MSKSQFNIRISGIAPTLYPTDTCYGLLWYNGEEALEIPKRYPYSGEWGDCISDCILLRTEYPMPWKLNVLWLSIIEQKFYILEELLPIKSLEYIWTHTGDISDLFSHIIIGMAPYGKVAFWFYGMKKSLFLAWLEAENVIGLAHDEIEKKLPMSVDKLCDYYIKGNLAVKENFEKNGLPPRNLFDKYMQQFTYRYLLVIEKWDMDEKTWQKYKEDEVAPVFDYIEEKLFDGTHDKLHNGGLMKYHQAGKPKKLRVQWHIGKSEYSAYFWFEDERIREVFDRFYGAHPDTKTDFIIRIDAEQRKYELALYRYGLKEPQIIPEDVYQLLVFKNKFEDYRSENYNQERGAWIW